MNSLSQWYIDINRRRITLIYINLFLNYEKFIYLFKAFLIKDV